MMTSTALGEINQILANAPVRLKQRFGLICAEHVLDQIKGDPNEEVLRQCLEALRGYLLGRVSERDLVAASHRAYAIAEPILMRDQSRDPADDAKEMQLSRVWACAEAVTAATGSQINWVLDATDTALDPDDREAQRQWQLAQLKALG